MVTLRTDELKRLNDGLKGECFSKHEIEFWHADFFWVSATCQVALFDKYLSLVLLWKEVLHVKRINQTFFYLQFHTWPYSGGKKTLLYCMESAQTCHISITPFSRGRQWSRRNTTRFSPGELDACEDYLLLNQTRHSIACSDIATLSNLMIS